MGLILIDNTLFRHSFGPEELQPALNDIVTARTAATDLDEQLACALQSGVEIEEASSAILFSKPSILYSAIRANKKLKVHRRATLNRCLALPGILKIGTHIIEPAKVYPREKKGGVLGVTLDFGLTHRTVQDIVKRIMSRHLKPRPFQYGLRGVHRAIADVKKLVAAGYVHAARLDIKNFFGSFELEKLAAELPLPHEVVEYAVHGRHIEVQEDQSIPTPLYIHLITLARQGLPPGSGCASIIAEFMISKLAWTMSKQVVIVNYCDDWLILASSSKYLEQAVGALTDAVAKLPGGHFELLPLDHGSAFDGFGFLGHRLQLVNGLVRTRTTVAPATVSSLYARLTMLDQKFSDLGWLDKPGHKSKAIKEALGSVVEMAAILRGWRAAFREADDVDRHTEWCEAIIAYNVAALGLTFDHVAAAIDDSMRYHPADYALAG